MKKMLCLALVLIASSAVRVRTQTPPSLPPEVVNELKVLDETYALLDQVADKVWPGWTGYRDWAFKFEFENGLSVLVGHPNPPKEYQPVEGLRIGNAAVAADRSRMTAVTLKPPFSGGGGLGSFGMTAAGERVPIINISLRMVRPTDAARFAENNSITTESKVLVYLHELFHEFQQKFNRTMYGNLMYNADADYATWSNIEGIALQRAYAEADTTAARERVKDFLAARALKRRSMTDEQRNQESYDDFMEGTANYAMVRALEVIQAGGFRPKLTTAEDGSYHGFADVDAMLAKYRDTLKKVSSRHEDPKMKCYDYGCFQALMCERLIPGWQAKVEKDRFIDAIMAESLPIADGERTAIEQRLKKDYPYEEVRADAAKFIDGRDAAWAGMKARKGRTYILDFKAIGQYLAALAEAKDCYRLGLITLYPSTYPGFRLDDIQVSPTTAPALVDQLYYIKAVDTAFATRKQPFAVTGTKQADGTWVDATVTTPVFTLKAPKVRIRETATRVKIQVLARVGGKT